MKMQKKQLIAMAIMLVFLTSCGVEEFNYVMSQAPGQIMLLFDRVPIKRVLKSKDLDPEVRKKLERALDIKEYSEKDLGLVHNNSYTIYRKLDREALSYNLTACPKLSLKPLRWQFPVVGEMPYLGFFKKEDAMKKEAELEKQGYDVYVRWVSAYSMLGIVSDPLYTPMLKYSDADLANTIIHELAHGTIWAKGYADFNENLALYIGNQGSLDYCISRFGKDSLEVKYALGGNEDDVTFQKYLAQLAKQLNDLYDRKDLSDDQKLKLKEQIFIDTKKDFKDNWIPKMKTTQYDRWPTVELNNATVASRLVYFHDLTLYEKVYEKNGSDLKKTVAFIKNVVDTQPGDPEKNLKKWLEQN
jgi:predicted aminopeptidase